MLRVLADHHHLAVALDDLALFADFLYRRFDFHCKDLLSISFAMLYDPSSDRISTPRR